MGHLGYLFGKDYYGTILRFCENYFENRASFWFWGAFIYNFTLFVLLNFYYGTIYLEWPFFEQYKIVPGPWPWKDKDPKKVKKWWDLY